jgi:hypothetical protein
MRLESMTYSESTAGSPPQIARNSARARRSAALVPGVRAFGNVGLQAVEQLGEAGHVVLGTPGAEWARPSGRMRDSISPRTARRSRFTSSIEDAMSGETTVRAEVIA